MNLGGLFQIQIKFKCFSILENKNWIKEIFIDIYKSLKGEKNE